MAQPPSQHDEDHGSVDEFAPERPPVQPKQVDLESAVLWAADTWRGAARTRRWYVGVPVALLIVGAGWFVWQGMQSAGPDDGLGESIASARVEQQPIVPPVIVPALPSARSEPAVPVDRSAQPIEKPQSTDAPAKRAAAEKPSPSTPSAPDASQVSPPMPRPTQTAATPSVPQPAAEDIPPTPPATAPAPNPAPPPATTKSAGGVTTWGSSRTPIEDPENVAIQDLLGRYRTAYAALDAAGVRQVWPSVNQRSLERAFRQLEGQDISFFSCTIDVEGAQAGASCVGTTNFIPKVGSRSPQSGPSQWNFKLSKRSTGPWLIDDVQAR